MASRKKKPSPRRSPSSKPRRARADASNPAAAAPPAPPGVTVIRKYANRRLYDTAASAHITQEDLYRMVSRGQVVQILDASSGEDITNQTLAQALIEHDPAKLRLMPAWLLHQMIRLHEHALGGWMSSLWQPLQAPTSPAAAWPGAAAMGSLNPWMPWPAAPSSPAPAPPADAQREAAVDELRREVSRLLRRLGELEQE